MFFAGCVLLFRIEVGCFEVYTSAFASLEEKQWTSNLCLVGAQVGGHRFS